MRGHLRAERIHGTGGVDKVAIQGAVQRGGPIVAKVVATPDQTTLQSNVRAWVESGATVYTDEARAYLGLDEDFAHKSVNHSREYVCGVVHTNTLENFWTLYKRAWRGTYTHNMHRHTNRYIDERAFSYNHREDGDLGRMRLATIGANGRRITYKQLTDNHAA
jgi:transposase-like protein